MDHKINQSILSQGRNGQIIVFWTHYTKIYLVELRTLIMLEKVERSEVENNQQHWWMDSNTMAMGMPWEDLKD